MEHFQGFEWAQVALIVCDKPGAGVIDRAKQFDVPVKLIQGIDLREPQRIIQILQDHAADLIVLAGFLRKIPSAMVDTYEGKIINIHPALLPKYGGKGMYGQHVHEAVIANQEKESGITIHLVNENYDEGAILFQQSCPVFPEDTADDLAARIHQLEHLHFPLIVEEQLSKG